MSTKYHKSKLQLIGKSPDEVAEIIDEWMDDELDAWFTSAVELLLNIRLYLNLLSHEQPNKNPPE